MDNQAVIIWVHFGICIAGAIVFGYVIQKAFNDILKSEDRISRDEFHQRNIKEAKKAGVPVCKSPFREKFQEPYDFRVWMVARSTKPPYRWGRISFDVMDTITYPNGKIILVPNVEQLIEAGLSEYHDEVYTSPELAYKEAQRLNESKVFDAYL